MNNALATGCSRCVMTTKVDPALAIRDGICNHCRRYDRLREARIVPSGERAARLTTLARVIKGSGGRDYDCIIGVSGGVDSSYVALKVKELGLRPLAVHVDNGWNSELAVSNVEKLLTNLDIDLETVVLDLREFHDLQRAFLFASTPDADIPSDHAIQAVLWQQAGRHGVKYIISGMNFATESISVPSWSYGHSDWRYIKSVHARFGRRRLKTYPHFGIASLLWTSAVRRIRIASILNYLEYDKGVAIGELTERLGWMPYPGKHYESIYTRWVQGHYLPEKFGIDKRRGHYSDLINSGQITRDEALDQLSQEDYPPDLRRADEALLMKKLSLSRSELDAILRSPASTFHAFENSYDVVQSLRWFANVLRRQGLYPR
jgi:N-acetyl sugar amidotransferase